MPVVQHDWFGLRSVMAWGGISTDLYRLNKLAYHVSFCRYQDEVLGAFVRPYTGSVSPGFLWVHKMPGLICQEHEGTSWRMKEPIPGVAGAQVVEQVSHY